MGAGVSALSERLTKDRALKIGTRYGFTEEAFDNMKTEDGTISVKELIDAVKKHADLQRFDTNHDGKIDQKEMKEIERVLTTNLKDQLSEGRTSQQQRKNFKAAISGTVRQEDYRKYYQLLTELGTGMSGTVFSVRSLSSGNNYACKSVRKRGLKEEELNKLRGEVTLLAQLDHPNIVKIVEAYEDKTHVTIIMELCNGGELYDSLITAEYYTENVARGIFKQIVHAIHYCHNQNVCHRDLKLENFVLDSKAPIKTGEETLKLIDFGLSKRYSTLNRMSTVVGTPYYIAPEIILAQKYGIECDIWSLGIILFMLLTGIPPVTGENDQELMANVAKGNLDLQNEWTPDWTQMASAFDLINKMLQTDPAKRITAKGIMEHPWLAESNSSAPIDLKIIDGMRKFSKMDPLQRIAAKIVAITLNTNEIEKLRAAFLDIDVDKSGIISMEEFTTAMKGSMAESKDVQILFQKIDMDGTGTISYTEFISACLTQTSALTKDRLLEAFNRLDPDQSGFIEQSELVELLKGVVSEEEAKELIKSADLADSDGKVSKAEFMSTMSILWNAREQSHSPLEHTATKSGATSPSAGAQNSPGEGATKS